MADPQHLWSLDCPGLRITETAPAISMVRVLRDDATAPARLGEAFGQQWPAHPNTITEGRVRVAWTAPGQWAVFGSETDLDAGVSRACAGVPHHLADVSAGRRLWRLEGRHACEIIAKGCSLDTHPDAMAADSCARTLLGEVPILLIASASRHSFDIVADVSLAGHIRAWFLEAAQEHQDARDPLRPADPIA